MICEAISASHICKVCQEHILEPKLYRRKLHNNIELLSFYKYEDIKKLLHTKHTDEGYHIFNILAQCSLKRFATEFASEEVYNAVGIDDHTRNGYSHTAILTKALDSKSIKPVYGGLRAKSHLSYSGKSKSFREKNPRKFFLRKKITKDIILVDDIVTTGTTMREAIELLGEDRVVLALALVDMSKK